MSQTFTGTITIGGDDYPSTAVFSKGTNRLVGTIYLTETEVEFPLSGVFNGTAFQTSRSFYFTGPASEVILVAAIPKEDTSVDIQFSEITFTATISIDEVPDVMTGTFTRVVSRISVPGIDQPDLVPVSTSSKKQLTRVRINEVGNILDHFGTLLSLPRNGGESNQEYKIRIKRASAKRSNSSYTGLVNGITNALGLAVTPSIRVSSLQDIEQGNRRFLIENGTVTIYSDWVPVEDQLRGLRPTVEQEATLGLAPVVTVGQLVDWINLSDFYSATVLSEAEGDTLFLLNADSRQLTVETIKPQEITMLKYGSILRGSLGVRTSPALATEKEDAEAVTEAGDFHLDYSSGRLTIFSPGSVDIKVSYLSSLDKFDLDFSPVRILDLSKKSMHKVLFEQTTQTFYQTVDDMTINGMPTDELYEIIRELLTAGDYDQFWGE